MLCNIKERIINLLCKLINMIKAIISFSIDVVIHPIENISFIFVFILYFILCETSVYKLSGKQMFLFSAGMVTILTFIVTFLQSVTVEANNKAEFYFGYNLKRDLYDNFWIESLYNIHIKLFLWIMFIIPCLRIVTNYNYEYKIFNNLNEFLKKYENNLYYIWISIAALVCVYCAAILIESINFAKNRFLSSNNYDSLNFTAKNKIESKVKKEYIRYFKSILNDNTVPLFINFHKKIDEYELMDYLFNKAKEVTDTQDDIIKYLEIAFKGESYYIYRIYNKIDKLIKKISKTNNSNRKNSRILLLKKYLEKVKCYYVKKWNSILQSLYYEYSFTGVCRAIKIDLLKLNELEGKFINKGVAKEIYNEIFNNCGSLNKMSCVNSEEFSNRCISNIIDVLIEMCKNSAMYEELDFNNDIYIILKNLNKYTNLEKYISRVFDCIFDYSFNCENNSGNFIKNFRNKLKATYCEPFIIDEAEKCSYNKVISIYSISDFQLKWLLSLLNNKDVIVVLIFSLAIAERSDKSYMSNSVYRIWKDRTNKLIYQNTIYEFNNDGYIDELIDKIVKSNVSHFIYPSFVKWLWKSLFDNFDSSKYQQFKELRDKGIRNNFGLCTYMIFRSLLLDKTSAYNRFLFTENENNEIQKELLHFKGFLL